MRIPALFLSVLLICTPVRAEDFELLFPVLCDFGRSCWVLNYMDADGDGPGAADYTCGPRSYAGHTGTDIALRDLKSAYDGVPVLAAADGRVVYARNDVVDTFFDPKTAAPSCGNAVVLIHDSGWETRYCHLKQNSVAVRTGEQVRAGQVIAQVGLSGGTTWPHLGFSVLRNGQFFDPASGRTGLEGCGLTPRPLWRGAQAYPYQPFSVFNLGFSIGPPREKEIDLGAAKLAVLPADTPSLSFWASVFGLMPGDRIHLQLLTPDGDALARQDITVEDAHSKSLFSVSARRGDGVWEPGVYKGLVTLKRGAGRAEQTTSWQRLILLAGQD